MPSLDMSVVIGFRDWGIDRLRRSVASLHGAFGGLDAEVIISDYGSADPELSRGVARQSGARWVHTPGDPVWSRSRALNAGFAVARGNLLVSTDADMLFAPDSLAAVHADASEGTPCAVFLQCRDLPADIPEELFDDIDDIPWAHLEHRSRLRPRWGMGGMMAIDREGFSRLHGFDERLHTYGREDMDFALRARRAGWRTHWSRDSRARMFHMWHPSTVGAVQSTGDGRRAINRNRRIVDSDATVSRNVESTRSPLLRGRPLVSIVVLSGATAEEQQRTLATALVQTVHDVEVIVGTGNCVPPRSGADDPRLIHHVVTDAGAGELSELVERSSGTYIAVVHSGDLLPLGRTAMLLRAIRDGQVGAYGWTAISQDDGSIVPGATTPNVSSLLMKRDAMQLLVGHSRQRGVAGISVEDFFQRTRLAPAFVDAPVLLALPSPGAGYRGVSPIPEAEVSISEAEVAELRLLLPADHRGARRRIAHLHEVAAERPEPEFDGFVSWGGIAHGAETIHAELSVEDPSDRDLVALAQAGNDLSLTGATDAPWGPAPGWAEHVTRHALRSGASLPLAIQRVKPVSESPEQSGNYTVNSRGEALTISARSRTPQSLRAEGEQGSPPWVLIGASIEEIWG